MAYALTIGPSARQAALFAAPAAGMFAPTGAGAQSEKDTLVVGFTNEATTLDRSRINGTADRFFIFPILELLVQPHRDGKVVPWLVEK